MYDTPFKSYDPQLGRFHQIDLMADIYSSQTPYNFANNDPIYWSDPTGLCPNCIQGNEGNSHYKAGGVVHDIADNSYWVYLRNGNWRFIPDYNQWVKYHPDDYNSDSHASVMQILSYGITASGNGGYQEPPPYDWGDGFQFSSMGNINAQPGSYDYDWSYTGNVLGVGGLIYDGLENAIANEYWWADKNGKYHSTKILKKGANGKYVRGVQGYRNGYNCALNSASKFRVAGNVVGGLGIGVTLLQYSQGQISGLEASVDTFFGVMGFLGPVGALVSATYFVGKLGYEYFSGNTLFNKPR